MTHSNTYIVRIYLSIYLSICLSIYMSGASRYLLVSDRPANGYAYSAIAIDRVQPYLSLMFGHIANYQARGTFNSPEQLSLVSAHTYARDLVVLSVYLTQSVHTYMAHVNVRLVWPWQLNPCLADTICARVCIWGCPVWRRWLQ